MLSKIFEKVKEWQTELILSLATILIAFLSFQVGKIQALNNIGAGQAATLETASNENWLLTKKVVTPADTQTKTPPNLAPEPINFQVVGSKNSDKYHFLWCPGASKISAKNKITFAGEAEAQTTGYTLASNCQK